MTGEPQVLQAPALGAQALMGLAALAALGCFVLLLLDVWFAVSIVPRRWAAAAMLGCFVVVGVSGWLASLPKPALVVTGEALALRIGKTVTEMPWTEVAGYTVCTREAAAGLGAEVPAHKKGARCLLVRRASGAPLVAFDNDIAEGVDEALEALRSQRPDLEMPA